MRRRLIVQIGAIHALSRQIFNLLLLKKKKTQIHRSMRFIRQDVYTILHI